MSTSNVMNQSRFARSCLPEDKDRAIETLCKLLEELARDVQHLEQQVQTLKNQMP